MRAVLIPADAARPADTVYLPPFEGWARRRLRRLAGTAYRDAGRDRGARLALFCGPSGSGLPRNERACLLTGAFVYGDAVLAALVHEKWEGDILVSVSRGAAGLVLDRLNAPPEIELTDSHAAL